MPQRCGVVALDIGGTKIACGLVLTDGSLEYSRTVPTSQESPESVGEQIVALATQAIEHAPRDIVTAAVGLVVPGWVNHTDRTVWAPNVAGWDHIPLEQLLKERLPLPIAVDSDRSGYVKGEAWLGVARGLSDVVFLAVGTGIGAGIMVDGSVLHGHDDLAGAVGWMALSPSFSELYGRMGCFEAEASGAGVGRKGAERLTGDPAREREPWTALRVVQAAIAGDNRATGIIDEVVVYLGMGIANLVSTLNPEMVVLGGGLFRAGDYLADKVRCEFVRWCQPFAARRVRIELSTLGDRAGLLGAARIAMDSFL
jgi:glucokinase